MKNLKKFVSGFIFITCISLCLFFACIVNPDDIPEPEIIEPSFLTIKYLPPSITYNNIENVFVHNAGGTLAECIDYENIEIKIVDDNISATARIPLVHYENDTPFDKSGYLFVSFNILDSDSNTYIHYKFEDQFSFLFSKGGAIVDLSNLFGTFTGGLTNYTNLEAPVIKTNTKFDLNGTTYTIKNDTPIDTPISPNIDVFYIYATVNDNEIEFICSTVSPVLNNYKKSYYNGNDRCLFKYVYIPEAFNTEYFFGKSNIDKHFTDKNLYYYTHTNPELLTLDNYTSILSLSGSNNPQIQTILLAPGLYIFNLVGAGGGIGYNSTAAGNGGRVLELISITTETRFFFYTGSGGKSGKEGLTADGGGGGGAGTFIHSADFSSYLLCAGGGGGSQGNKETEIKDITGLITLAYQARGKAGAGGSIGHGGAGGNGENEVSSIIGAANGYGGEGGGFIINKNTTYNIQNNPYKLSNLSNILEGFNQTGNRAGEKAFYINDSLKTQLNTKDANGTGNGTIDEKTGTRHGGNNRNGIRGNGSRGGAPSTSASGLSGRIEIYKL